jgi:hypothetical protein
VRFSGRGLLTRSSPSATARPSATHPCRPARTLTGGDRRRALNVEPSVMHAIPLACWSRPVGEKPGLPGASFFVYTDPRKVNGKLLPMFPAKEMFNIMKARGAHKDIGGAIFRAGDGRKFAGKFAGCCEVAFASILNMGHVAGRLYVGHREGSDRWAGRVSYCWQDRRLDEPRFGIGCRPRSERRDSTDHPRHA